MTSLSEVPDKSSNLCLTYLEPAYPGTRINKTFVRREDGSISKVPNVQPRLYRACKLYVPEIDDLSEYLRITSQTDGCLMISYHPCMEVKEWYYIASKSYLNELIQQDEVTKHVEYYIHKKSRTKLTTRTKDVLVQSGWTYFDIDYGGFPKDLKNKSIVELIELIDKYLLNGFSNLQTVIVPSASARAGVPTDDKSIHIWFLVDDPEGLEGFRNSIKGLIEQWGEAHPIVFTKESLNGKKLYKTIIDLSVLGDKTRLAFEGKPIIREI